MALHPGTADFSAGSYQRKGYVYVVSVTSAEREVRLKVGFTARPVRRFYQLAGRGNSVSVLCCVHGTVRLERELLEFFKPHVVRGHEWLRDDPGIRAMASSFGGELAGRQFGPNARIRGHRWSRWTAAFQAYIRSRGITQSAAASELGFAVSYYHCGISVPRDTKRCAIEAWSGGAIRNAPDQEVH